VYWIMMAAAAEAGGGGAVEPSWRGVGLTAADEAVPCCDDGELSANLTSFVPHLVSPLKREKFR
jgi:hypothetical protein